MFAAARANSPISSQHQALKGDYAGYYRYRIGDYRIIYSVDDELVQVFVMAIAHRSEAYEP